MKKNKFYKTKLLICLVLVLFALSIQNARSQAICTQTGTDYIAGVQDDYRYVLWNQNAQGTACMTLGSGALFSGEWSGIQNYLARRGLGYDQTQEHQEIGTFYSTYNCNYNPSSASGNSYLSIYGWTVDSLIEFYIVEDWRNWIPSMDPAATFKDTITINGSIYEIYENTRENQPSILGTATFQQYFSIRRNRRNSGLINISEHFNKWESLGMDLGKMYEVTFVVEGYQSSGSFEFTALDVFLSDDPPLEIKETELPASLIIYPNPAKDCIKLNISEPAKANIYTTLGQQIMTTQVSSDNDLIQLSDLSPGNYLLNIQTRDEVISEIVIIE